MRNFKLRNVRNTIPQSDKKGPIEKNGLLRTIYGRIESCRVKGGLRVVIGGIIPSYSRFIVFLN